MNSSRRAESTGVITLSGRLARAIALALQLRTQMPHPRHASASIRAFFFVRLRGSAAETRATAPMGQTPTHLPHPVQFPSSTEGR